MTDRDDWLAWRRGGLGASDIAALMGISPWASPWSVWADKCGLLPPEPENEYMAAGRWLERAIGPWFEDVTGLAVAGEQMWCTHKQNDWARCTPDGFVFDVPPGALLSQGADAVAMDIAHGPFEVKVLGFGKRWDPIPPYYQAQGQWQMYVTDMPKCFFAVLHGRRLEVYELDRDPADIEFMVERAECFWRDHVLAGVPRPPMPATPPPGPSLRSTPRARLTRLRFSPGSSRRGASPTAVVGPPRRARSTPPTSCVRCSGTTRKEPWAAAGSSRCAARRHPAPVTPAATRPSPTRSESFAITPPRRADDRP